MGTIAKGEITLSPVNDAYTVLLTPSSCTINADFDGSNPKLSGAHGSITVKRGSKDVLFHVTGIAKSSSEIGVSFSNASTLSMPFALLGISNTELSGWVDFTLVTEDGFNYTTTVRFAFTVVRESTMLDWIQDWEGGKTKIGDTYLMTPKLFVGRKEDVVENIEVEGPDSYRVETQWIEGALTGVYIGPDLLSTGESSAGIYGYRQSHEIFHINADGGYIGGWTFNEGGLQSSNGVVNILSEGSIYAQNPSSETPYWGIYSDGSAQFANGKVKFYANGSAEYEGSITAKSGTIGGWKITETQIFSSRLILDSAKQAIGCFSGMANGDGNGGVVFPLNPNNGVLMYYTSASDFGIKGRCEGNTVFQLGSTNYIAGWNFNHQAIWTGSEAPYLTQGAYAANEGELTVAPNGLRCHKWYIDANGTASFTGGSVKFDTDKAEIFGWLMRTGRFSSAHAALSSVSSYCGLFVSPADLSEISSYSLINTISNNGGFYLYSDGSNSIMRAYDQNGNLGFYLSTAGYNTIGNWHFDHTAIYIGNTNTDDNGFTSDSGSMILATTGLIGHKWKLMADGSGAIANGNISWDASGNVTLANSVTIGWANISGAIGNKLTHIDANGIYTGTISADNVTAGTLIGSAAKQAETDPKWSLNADGSGHLAGGNISWGEDGSLRITGQVDATSGSIGLGSNKFNITSNGIAFGDISSWAMSDNSKKLLLSPESLKIQHSNPEDSNEICKIYLGKEAWPSRSSSFPYGTVAWIYKKDLADLEMEGSRCSEPAFRIDTITRYGGGVAISTSGAIVSDGVIAEKGYYIETDSSIISVVNLSPFQGSRFIVKNDTDNKPINLPSEGMVRFVYDLAVNESFMHKIIVHSLIGNKALSLGVASTDNIKYYVNGTLKINGSVTINAGTTYEMLLIFDGNSRISYWYIKSI